MRMAALSLLVLTVGCSIIAAPVALAFKIESQAAQFQKVAFGHFAAAAKRLRHAVWATFGFYVLVMVESFVRGIYVDLFLWPLTAQDFFVYARIIALFLAFALFGRVASSLYAITIPAGAPRRNSVPPNGTTNQE